MSALLHDRVDEVCRRFWQQDPIRFYEAIRDEGWFRIDWPEDLGGPAWNRQEQLAFLTKLAEHRCPLPPESITVAMPLIVALAGEDKRSTLQTIEREPWNWQVQPDKDADALFLVSEGHASTTLVEPGQAMVALTHYSSLIWQLYEWMLGLAHIEALAAYWQDDLSKEILELQVELDAGIALFLRNTSLADRQVRLKSSQSRLTLFSTLFQVMGYYALLDPAPELTGNEPVPFPEERRYLAQLRMMIARNETLQLDQIYQELNTDE